MPAGHQDCCAHVLNCTSLPHDAGKHGTDYESTPKVSKLSHSLASSGSPSSTFHGMLLSAARSWLVWASLSLTSSPFSFLLASSSDIFTCAVVCPLHDNLLVLISHTRGKFWCVILHHWCMKLGWILLVLHGSPMLHAASLPKDDPFYMEFHDCEVQPTSLLPGHSFLVRLSLLLLRAIHR